MLLLDLDRTIKLRDQQKRPKNFKEIKETFIKNNSHAQFFQPIIKNKIHELYNSKNSSKKHKILTQNVYVYHASRK